MIHRRLRTCPKNENHMVVGRAFKYGNTFFECTECGTEWRVCFSEETRKPALVIAFQKVSGSLKQLFVKPAEEYPELY